MPTTPGNQTSEWTAVKWAGLICAALAAGLSVILAAGAVPPDSLAGAIMAGAVAVLTAVGGAVGKSYIAGRSAIKANAALAEGAKSDPT